MGGRVYEDVKAVFGYIVIGTLLLMLFLTPAKGIDAAGKGVDMAFTAVGAAITFVAERVPGAVQDGQKLAHKAADKPAPKKKA